MVLGQFGAKLSVNLTFEIGGENIGNVEKFQISIHDRCGGVHMLTNFRFLHMTDVEKSEILSNLKKF